jgi:acetyl-CoA C-acetyltransferase
MAAREVVVLSGARTAIGRFGGSLKDIPPTALASAVAKEAIDRAGIAPEDIQHAVFGNCFNTDKRDFYFARVAAVDAGVPVTAPAFTVSRLCGSGLQAIISASQMILLGDIDVALAGGGENMSRIPYWATNMRWGQRMGDGTLVDVMTTALTDPFEDCHMGQTAENVASEWGVSREDQDLYSVESHRRAAAAIKEGIFKEQVLPIQVKGKGGPVAFENDEHVRTGVDMEAMGKLRPAFSKTGTVTAGNASGTNDAAGAVVLMERSEAERRGLEPMALLTGYSFAGVEPRLMGIGPTPAVNSLLEKTGLKVEDFDTIELNEAFAAQALAVIRDLNLPLEKTNPHGSGISLGHPVAATGAILTIKALYEMRRTDTDRALVTMCIGGGQGIAAAYQRLR